MEMATAFAEGHQILLEWRKITLVKLDNEIRLNSTAIACVHQGKRVTFCEIVCVWYGRTRYKLREGAEPEYLNKHRFDIQFDENIEPKYEIEQANHNHYTAKHRPRLYFVLFNDISLHMK